MGGGLSALDFHRHPSESTVEGHHEGQRKVREREKKSLRQYRVVAYSIPSQAPCSLRRSGGLWLPPFISYHRFVPLTNDVRSQAGVGKSSLINRVFSVKEAVRSHSQRCVQLTELAVDQGRIRLETRASRHIPSIQVFSRKSRIPSARLHGIRTRGYQNLRYRE